MQTEIHTHRWNHRTHVPTGFTSFSLEHLFPLLLAIQCSAPQRIANGKYNSQASVVFTKGAFVEYSCEPAYKLIGEARIYCTESGTWSSPAPYCEGKFLLVFLN